MLADLLRMLLLTSGRLGYMRPAPGTWGSLPAPALAFLLVLIGAPRVAIDASMIGLLVVSGLACLAFGQWAETYFGRKDPSQIVADETSGQALVLLFLPDHCYATPLRAMLTLGSAFILFRLFDIWKPPPARGLQRLPGGTGVLVDDLIAAVYAAAILQVATRMVWPMVTRG